MVALREKILGSAVFNKLSDYFTALFSSNFFLLFIAVATICGFAFDAEIVSIFILLVFFALNLVFVKDLSFLLLAIVFISIIPMKFGNKPLDGFFVVAYSAIFVVPALFLRFILYPMRAIGGRNALPLFVYSVVLVLGGFGSGILISQYFAFYPIYTVLGLGFLQMGLYFLFQNYLTEDPRVSADHLAKMMCVVGAVCVGMIFVYILQHIVPTLAYNLIIKRINSIILKISNSTNILPSLLQTRAISLPSDTTWSWKNYISDIVLLSMPFAFYFAVKSKWTLPFLIFGAVQYLFVVLTRSAGGILFGTAMMPFLVLFTILRTKGKYRIQAIAFFVLLLLAALAGAVWKREELIALVSKKLNSGGTGRMDLYWIAWQRFTEYPIFGVGVGHDHTQYPVMVGFGFIMTYFHSTVFQALGATGLVGLVGYMYMALSRLRTYINKRNFNVFLLIGFLGYACYSMIDVGTAIPLPFVAITTYFLVVCEKLADFDAMSDVRQKWHYSRTEREVLLDADARRLLAK